MPLRAAIPIELQGVLFEEDLAGFFLVSAFQPVLLGIFPKHGLDRVTDFLLMGPRYRSVVKPVASRWLTEKHERELP